MCATLPSVPNGAVGPGFDYQNAVRNITCQLGFMLSTPDNTITCQGDGNWSAINTTCTIRKCTVFAVILSTSSTTQTLQWDKSPSLLVMILKLFKFNYLYICRVWFPHFLRKLNIVIHSSVETSRTEVYMPRLSIGRNLQRPQKNHGMQEIIKMMSD